MVLSAHNEAKERLLLLLSINDHPPSEEPMAAVLTARQTGHEGVIFHAIADKKNTLSFGVYSLETTHTCWTEPDQSILHWWDSFSLSGRVQCSSPDPKSQTPTLFIHAVRQTNRQQPDKYEMKKKMITNTRPQKKENLLN